MIIRTLTRPFKFRSYGKNQMYKSTKKIGPISTNHRNWHALYNENRDSRHCSLIHGYSRIVEFVFVGKTDACQWVVDFGNLKDVKKWLEERWDHKTLIASDDPQLDKIVEMDHAGIIDLTTVDVDNGLGWGPGMEGSCKWVFDEVGKIIREKTDGLAAIESVQIWEHENNSAIYRGDHQDYVRLGYNEGQIGTFFPHIPSFYV